MSININKLQSTDLSKKTIENYIFRIQRLENVTNQPIEWIMTHPKKTIKTIKENISAEPATIANYITVICKLYNVHSQFAQAHIQSKQTYQTYLTYYRLEVNKAYKQSKYKSKQEDKKVEWKIVQDYYCQYKNNPITKISHRDNLHCLLLAFLLNLRPKRADYGNLRIYQTKPQSNPSGNYVIMSPKPHLVLNNYKTAKLRGMIKEDIPFELYIQLKDSLKLLPRDHVFVSLHKDMYLMPYEKNNSYSQWVMRIFGKHFGKQMGVSLWRTVYINANVDFQNDSYEELEKGAHLSGHSIQQQFLTYRKFSDSAKGDRRPPGEKHKPVKC